MRRVSSLTGPPQLKLSACLKLMLGHAHTVTKQHRKYTYLCALSSLEVKEERSQVRLGREEVVEVRSSDD